MTNESTPSEKAQKREKLERRVATIIGVPPVVLLGVGLIYGHFFADPPTLADCMAEVTGRGHSTKVARDACTENPEEELIRRAGVGSTIDSVEEVVDLCREIALASDGKINVKDCY